MANWKDVGKWLKENAGTGTALIGSLLTGNAPAAIASGISLVTGATGKTSPTEVLDALQTDPQTKVKLKELYYKNEDAVRNHIETMERLRLEDEQSEHTQTQETIRSGDNATDKYVRRTRPQMAKQSWTATIAYCIGCFGVDAITSNDIFNVYIAVFLSTPAWAYLGLRTGDKFANAWRCRGEKK